MSKNLIIINDLLLLKEENKSLFSKNRILNIIERISYYFDLALISSAQIPKDIIEKEGHLFRFLFKAHLPLPSITCLLYTSDAADE